MGVDMTVQTIGRWIGHSQTFWSLADFSHSALSTWETDSIHQNNLTEFRELYLVDQYNALGLYHISWVMRMTKYAPCGT